MSTRLVILGLLRDRPLHGYEIKHIIKDHMDDWTSIAFGSIYFALKKLTAEGLLQVEATEQRGNRPSRTVFRITDAGRAEFLRLLRQLWASTERHYYATDIGLFFMDALPRDEIVGCLNQRIVQLEAARRYLAEHRDESLANPHVPRRAAWIFDHSQRHLDAELEWTRSVLADIEGDPRTG